jgi:uncharacterized membrane protein
MKLVSQNYLGLSVIATSAAAFIILLTVSLDYAKITHSLCDAPYCTLYNHIPVQAYAGFGLLIVSSGIGSYLAFMPPKLEKTHAASKAKLNKLTTSLHGDEKKIFDQLAKNDGTVFQNDLTSSTGFSKVKISRILDRLEAKGLVERRRRGMGNMVVLRQ